MQIICFNNKEKLKKRSFTPNLYFRLPWNFVKSTNYEWSSIFRENSNMQIFACLKNFVKSIFQQNLCKSQNFAYTHIVEKWKITLIQKIFRQINYLAIYIAKTLLSRNFCQKSVRANFCNYHTVCPWLYMSFENCPWLYVHDFWKFVFTVLFHDSRVFKCFMQKLNFTKIESL